MAKDFRYYDKLYASYRGRYMPYEIGLEKNIRAAAEILIRWSGNQLPWTQKETFEAVYEAEGFEDWQKFRVSMKGQSTSLKLARLAYRQGYFLDTQLWAIEKCRIDNYINTMKRNGLLDIAQNIAMAHFCGGLSNHDGL